MRDRDDDRLPDELSEAVDLLREEEPMRPEWRAELLRRAAATKAPARRVSLSVPWAIAAGLLCAIVGGGAVKLMLGRPATGDVVAVRETGTAATLPVKFSVVAPNAARVSIVGDFNRWDPTTLPMKRSADGRLWEVEVRLPLGLYTYAFMIDGRILPDPGAPRTTDDGFGSPNSVLMVRGT